MIKTLPQLPPPLLKNLYMEALLVSFRSWTDELSQMPISKSIDLCLESKRRLLTIRKRQENSFSEKPYYEFGMSTMGRPYYFVWIYVSEKESIELFEKFKIEY